MVGKVLSDVTDRSPPLPQANFKTSTSCAGIGYRRFYLPAVPFLSTISLFPTLALAGECSSCIVAVSVRLEGVVSWALIFFVRFIVP